jgi:hypothetical protein
VARLVREDHGKEEREHVPHPVKGVGIWDDTPQRGLLSAAVNKVEVRERPASGRQVQGDKVHPHSRFGWAAVK